MYFDNNFDGMSEYTDEDGNSQRRGFKSQYVNRSQDRILVIMFRGDGNGGIQGILMDCYYIDDDGKVANEFYIVTDNQEGEIMKVEDEKIRKLTDPVQVQKVFYQYFVHQKPQIKY